MTAQTEQCADIRARLDELQNALYGKGIVDVRLTLNPELPESEKTFHNVGASVIDVMEKYLNGECTTVHSIGDETVMHHQV